MGASLLGSANPMWKGGPPAWTCRTCGRAFRKYTWRGRPRRFCGRRCHNAAKGGAGNPNWKGGLAVKSAYIRRHVPQHPRADSWGYVDEHVLVAERALGAFLPPRAVVHHANEDRRDNRPENLVICESQGYHRLLHARMSARRKEMGR